jgi:dolichyl-phosphate-mannose-protein mannosyltransferase
MVSHTRGDLWRDPWLYAVAVFAIGFHLPLFRWLLWLADEGVSIHAAVKILNGHTPYRDFFEILPPGSFLIVAAWMKVFGQSFASVRALAIVTVATTAVLVYTAARLVSGRGVVAAGIAAAWTASAPWFDINHHWFTTAASMASAVSLMIALTRGPSRLSLFTAGLFAGGAAMITHTRGALLAAAVLAVVACGMSDGIRRVRWVIAGLVVAPAGIAVYLAASGALQTAVAEVIVFPLRHYAGIQVVAFGASATLADAGLVAFFPLTVLLAAVTVARGRWRSLPFGASVALAAVGFIGAYPRPDTVHLAFATPLAAPLLASTTSGLLAALESVRTRLALSVLLALLTVWVVGYGTLSRLAMLSRPRQTILTPRGPAERAVNVWTSDLAQLVAGIDRHTSRDARFFFYPFMPMLPYLLDRHHVGRTDVMVPGYTTSAQYADACAEVLARAEWVVIDRTWTDPHYLKTLFPALTDANPGEKRRFETALTHGFQAVHTSRSFEVRQRTARAGPALCGGIAGGD